MEAGRVVAVAALLAGALPVVGCKHGEPAPGAAANPTAPTSAKEPDDELARMLRPDPAPFAPGPDGSALTASAKPVTGPVEEKQVKVSGVARDAAMGAVVVDDAGATWYVEGLERWQAGWSGKRVLVSGVSRERKLAPDPTVGPKGEVSAGMVGTSRVIVRPTWQRVE